MNLIVTAMIRYCSQLALFICCLQIFLTFGNSEIPESASNSSAKAEPTPDISINLTFDKEILRESDCIPVQIFLINKNQNPKVTASSIRIAHPDFISIDEKDCSSPKNTGIQQNNTANVNATNTNTDNEPTSDNKIDKSDSLTSIFQIMPFNSGEVAADDIRIKKLFLRTNSEIFVGDYNLLFIISYSWSTEGKSKQSVVTQEKKLKVSFLGSDSIAGIPFGIASLIIPGLFFWLTLELFGVAWKKEDTLGSKLIYSVVVSLLIIIISSSLRSFVSLFPEHWLVEKLDFLLSFLDIRSGVSIGRLLALAGFGVFTGILISLINFKYLSSKEKEDIASEILPGDSKFIIIEKLLRRDHRYNPSSWKKILRKWIYNPKIENKSSMKVVEIVEKQPDNEYKGYLGHQGKDFTSIMGLIQIEVGKSYPQNKLKILQDLKKCDLLYELFRQAKNDGLKIEYDEGIKLIEYNEEGIQTGETTVSGDDGFAKKWKNSEVKEIIAVEQQESYEVVKLIVKDV